MIEKTYQVSYYYTKNGHTRCSGAYLLDAGTDEEAIKKAELVAAPYVLEFVETRVIKDTRTKV